MKWKEEDIKKLETLLLEGKKYDEISDIIGFSKRAVENKSSRLGLKIVSTKTYSCLHCNKKFEGLISKNRKFCSRSCSVTYNNIGKEHSDETKKKISLRVSERMKSDEIKNKISGENHRSWIKDRSLLKKKVEKVNKKRKCKYCKKFNIIESKVRICKKCRFEYYEAYRPACRFKFSLNDFPEEFSFDLIKEHGWYSPSNSSSPNLNGISRDHIYSVSEGFKNGVGPYVISHPANCRLMIHNDNNSKNNVCVITLEELNERIDRWNNKYK